MTEHPDGQSERPAVPVPRSRLAAGILGTVLLPVGVVMLVCPGPGLVVLGISLASLLYAFTGRGRE